MPEALRRVVTSSRQFAVGSRQEMKHQPPRIGGFISCLLPTATCLLICGYPSPACVSRRVDSVRGGRGGAFRRALPRRARGSSAVPVRWVGGGAADGGHARRDDAIQPPASVDDVPVLIVTGAATTRCTPSSRVSNASPHPLGARNRAAPFRARIPLARRVYVAVSKFELKPIPGLEIVTDADVHSRSAAVDEFLRVAGVDRSMPHEEIGAALMRHVRSARPITSYLEDRLARLRDYGPRPYRSVLLGFPLPSILTYQTGGLTVVARELGLGDDFIASVKEILRERVADDLVAVDRIGERGVLVAHTTGVGAMV